jgi:hypothetical protein
MDELAIIVSFVNVDMDDDGLVWDHHYTKIHYFLKNKWKANILILLLF